MTVEEKILKLTRQLYPTGRAFKMPFGGELEKLHKGLAKSEARAYTHALSTLDSALPDNDNFTADDATDWERRLGIVSNGVIPLADRKAAIKRKMAHPGTVLARQNYRYLQGQLLAAGFNVFVYENRVADGMGGYNTQSPGDLTGGVGVLSAQHGDFQHGDFQHGGFYQNIIANYIDENVDWDFNIGSNLRSTFFIGGNPLGTFANVPIARKEQFRQLILKTKPAQTVGFLFINYI